MRAHNPVDNSLKMSYKYALFFVKEFSYDPYKDQEIKVNENTTPRKNQNILK